MGDDAPRGRVDELTVEALAARLDGGAADGPPVVVLDVRHRDAWARDPHRIPGAVWVPLDEIPARARDLPRDAHLVVYCA